MIRRLTAGCVRPNSRLAPVKLCRRAALDSVGRQIRCDDGPFDNGARFVIDGVTVAINVYQVAFFQEHELLCHRNERCHIGGNKTLADTNAHHQWAASPGTHQLARILPRNRANGVSATQLRNRGADRVQQGTAFTQVAANLMGHDFRIGFGSVFYTSPGL